MPRIRFLVALATVLLVGLFADRADAVVPTGSAANNPSAWEAHLLNDKGVSAQCFKHEGNELASNVHGVSAGNAVKLNAFDQSWFGDHWALLVIKSSTNNQVIYGPQAGVWYTGVGQAAVSHWIVCKGETPTPPPTTVPPTTVTTLPPTTTVPPSTTTPPTTTIVTTTTVDPTPPTETPVERPSFAPPTQLAHTGVSAWWLGSIGVLVMYAGFALMRLARRVK